MLKNLLKQLKSWFGSNPPPPAENGRSQPSVSLGQRVGNVTIKTQSQLDKHTEFKVGEQYRLGEAIVTLHASKADARRAVLMTTLKRRAKRKALKARAIELMLMTPEELQKLKIEEWLTKREKKHLGLKGFVRRIKGYSTAESNKILAGHESPPPTTQSHPESKALTTTKVRDKLKAR